MKFVTVKWRNWILGSNFITLGITELLFFIYIGIVSPLTLFRSTKTPVKVFRASNCKMFCFFLNAGFYF
jgi:hypothetical protein